MEKLYSSPLRVYLTLAFLAAFGIWSGFQLPISLYPNSSKAEFWVEVPFGPLSPEEFLNNYGSFLESSFRSIKKRNLKVEKLEADYGRQDVTYTVNFQWGSDIEEAKRELQNVISARLSSAPTEIRDFYSINTGNGSGGFLAISFYSNQMSPAKLYSYLKNVFNPPLSKIEDAEWAGIWSPETKEVQVELKPQLLANYNILPRHIEASLQNSLQGYNGGTLKVAGKNFFIMQDKAVDNIDDIKNVVVPSGSGKAIKLSDVANVSLRVPTSGIKIFKTSGSSSVILWAQPKADGNVKKMAEDILAIVEKQRPLLPSHIEYKVLVDPSEFIRSAIKNVLKEVFLAAFLAVFVLFFFIGSFKNVATAAVEIPLSIILAFIPMKFFNMNINLISLGGLALSAGMNVDASVVVMENIFRYFEKVKGQISYAERLKLVVAAVSEVKLPIIASTIASVIVFLPLIYTQGIAEALLGDLAKAVVFSHGLSAVVALILVPTIRLQMLSSSSGFHEKPSLIDPLFVKLELFYERSLSSFINRRSLQALTGAILLSLVALITFVIYPRLPQELVGKPDSDYLMVGINKQGNSNARQMESQSDEIEANVLNQLGDSVRYSFVQIHNDRSAWHLYRLQDRKLGKSIKKDAEKFLKDDATTQYYVDIWNPSEFRLPEPLDLEIHVQAANRNILAQASKLIKDKIQDTQLYPRVSNMPNLENPDYISIHPRFQQWAEMGKAATDMRVSDIADLSRIATRGKIIYRYPYDKELININLVFPDEYINSIESLQSLPLGLDNKVIPLKALADITVKKEIVSIYRVNENEINSITGKFDSTEKPDEKVALAKAKEVANETAKEFPSDAQITLNFLDTKKELNDSLKSLTVALFLSAALIFLTMVFQIGSVGNSLLVLVAVPLGIIGVFLSLYAFQSTISLNSFLGMILLNGIAVANSIILVDFLNRMHASGLSPKEAALKAAKTRLRPIMMTTLTTILGMLPIAIGAGEGGKILQPLGIAVAGGLWFSTLLTLYIVPTLQVYFLEWKERR